MKGCPRAAADTMRCLFCDHPLTKRPGEKKQSYERRRYCNRTCSGLNQRRPINHGTVSGYNVHLRRGEEPCAECHARRLAWQRERYPSIKTKLSPRAKARHRAMRMVVTAHYEEYSEHLLKEYARLGV